MVGGCGGRGRKGMEETNTSFFYPPLRLCVLCALCVSIGPLRAFAVTFFAGFARRSYIYCLYRDRVEQGVFLFARFALPRTRKPRPVAKSSTGMTDEESAMAWYRYKQRHRLACHCVTHGRT